MKQFFTLFTFIMFAFSMNAQYIYNDFDANQNVPFVGGAPDPTIVANPFSGGINTSPNVAEWVRGGWEWSNAKATVEGFIDFTTGTTFTLKAYSPINTTVKFKLEGIIGPIEVDQPITAGSWQELSFDFPGAPNDSYNAIVIFFDPGTFTADTYHFDDVEGPEVSNDPPPVGTLTLPVTFDDPDAAYDLIDFGGTSSEIIEDPDNAANNIVKTIKSDIAEFWAGTTVGGTLGFAEPLPFTADSTLMGVVVWSPEEGIPVRLKVEDATNGGIFCETDVITTVANAWDTLVFDFNMPVGPPLNLANTYDKASIFFNFGTTGGDAGEQTYYWDYMYFKGAPEPKPYAELDVQDNFENDGWGTINEWFFQDPGMVTLPTVPDPEDGSNTVANYNRTGGFQWTNAQFVLDHIMDLTERNKFEMDVYFPSSNNYSGALTMGAAIKLQDSKLGGNAWTTQTEVIVNVEELDTWVTLTFDLSAASDREDYDQVVVQFGGEGHNDPAQFYFDNLYLKHVPYLTVLTPNGGEVVEQGEDLEITWDYDYWDGPIQIDLIKGDDELTLAYNIQASDMSFTWTVFDNQEIGDDYIIRISGLDSEDPSDDSDDYFAVTEAYNMPQIIISEIMYNPPESGNDSLEFLEFYNKGTEPINMAGFYMSQGVEHIFPSIVIEPDTFLVLSIDSLAFFATFGIESLQWTSGALSNGGEPVELSDQFGNIINTVAYDDQLPWDTLADGYGPSLELLNSGLDNSLPESWMHSVNFLAVNSANDSIWATPGFGFAGLSAAFEANNTVVMVGDSVMFTDLSTGTPTSWMWTFEGGTPATYEGQTPPYIVYSEVGLWDVTLTVSDGSDSDEMIYADYIEVFDQPAPMNLQALVGPFDDVQLSWDAPATDDVIGYNVYRDGDKINEETVLVNEFNDMEPPLGSREYFVTALYETGESLPSNVVSVIVTDIDELAANSMLIYPNPASSQLNISLPEEFSFDIYMINLSGQRLNSLEKQSGLIQLSTSQLRVGIYILMIRNTESGETTSQKIIIK